MMEQEFQNNIDLMLEYGKSERPVNYEAIYKNSFRSEIEFYFEFFN